MAEIELEIFDGPETSVDTIQCGPGTSFEDGVPNKANAQEGLVDSKEHQGK